MQRAVLCHKGVQSLELRLVTHRMGKGSGIHLQDAVFSFAGLYERKAKLGDSSRPTALDD